MNNITKIYAKLISSLFLLFAIVSFLAIFSFNTKLVFGSVLYFVFTIVAIKYFKEINPIFILIGLLYPLIFFNLRIGLSKFERNWIVVPSTVFLILSTTFSFLYWKYSKKLFLFILPISIGIWFFFFAEKYKDKMTYGFTKGENINLKAPSYVLFDSKGENYKTNNPNKTLILDFWNSNCGPCYDLFPTIDSINKIIDSSKFEIATINIPLINKKEDNYDVLTKYNYSFLNLFADNKNMADSFGIKYYPTTVIIKNNFIVFRGEFLEGIKKLNQL